MSIERNPQALATAFKKCKGKIAKIKELGITPDMSDERVDALIENLAAAKSKDDSSDLAENIKGQRWYVEGLVKFSGLSTKDQLEFEYNDAFANSASEDEMLDILNKISA